MSGQSIRSRGNRVCLLTAAGVLAAGAAQAAPRAMSTGSGIAGVVRRQSGVRGTTSTVTTGVPTAARALDPTGNFALVGVTQLGDRVQAYLVDLSTHQRLTVAPGGTAFGFAVKDVGTERVVLTRDGRQFVLRLGQRPIPTAVTPAATAGLGALTATPATTAVVPVSPGTMRRDFVRIEPTGTTGTVGVVPVEGSPGVAPVERFTSTGIPVGPVNGTSAGGTLETGTDPRQLRTPGSGFTGVPGTEFIQPVNPTVTGVPTLVPGSGFVQLPSGEVVQVPVTGSTAVPGFVPFQGLVPYGPSFPGAVPLDPALNGGFTGAGPLPGGVLYPGMAPYGAFPGDVSPGSVPGAILPANPQTSRRRGGVYPGSVPPGVLGNSMVPAPINNPQSVRRRNATGQ